MRGARPVRVSLLIALPVAALLVLSAGGAAAAERVTVTPAVGLHDGQTVRVQAAGYTPGKSLTVVECSAVPGASVGDCDIAHAYFVNADAQGSVDVNVSVSVGPFGLNRVQCGAPPGCIISVSDVAFVPTELATAPIRFAAGAGASPGTPAVTGKGGFDPSVLVLVPVLLGGIWAVAILRWVGRTNTLPLVAGGLLVIGAATAQVYALVTASATASGITAASQYAAWDVATDAVGIALIIAGVALRFDAVSHIRRLAAGALSLLAIPAGLVLLVPAVSTLGKGPQNEGGGTIWYGAAACVAAAICAAVAALIAVRRT